MPSSAQARIALNRFGLGACPGDVAAVSPDPMGWLVAQIAAPAAPPIAGVPSAAARLVAAVFHLSDTDLLSRLQGAVASPAPFLERLAMFWSNHFSVVASKVLVTCTAVPYENEAIRPFVTGRFVDMLTATSRHPAMLAYLDLNNQVGPNSPHGLRAHSHTFDENYAREVMELHTVGVDAGYTQADVDQLALALTGWAIDRTTGAVVYDPAAHEPGTKTVLGSVLPAGDGQAAAAMAMLANHPATRVRICTKLAAHFVSDTPPPALVSAMVGAWGNGGVLAAVYHAMVTHPLAWQATAQKFKTPEQFVISAARALGAPGWIPGQQIQPALSQLSILGQPWFRASSPQGFPDDQASWLTPSQALLRLDAAATLANHRTTRILPTDLLAELLAPAAGSHTTDAVANAPSRSEAYALLLASPDFQRS